MLCIASDRRYMSPPLLFGSTRTEARLNQSVATNTVAGGGGAVGFGRIERCICRLKEIVKGKK